MGVEDFGFLAQSRRMKRILLAALLAAVCIGVFVQYQALRKLNAEAERLRAVLAEAHARGEAERASRGGETTESELERLREERSELVRLRGQVAELRRNLKSMQQAMTRANSAAGAAAKTNIADLVQAFVANIQATVPPRQTLVTGGWQLPSGKHALFFIEPCVVGPDGNVHTRGFRERPTSLSAMLRLREAGRQFRFSGNFLWS